jgi:hypothetical protein
VSFARRNGRRSGLSVTFCYNKEVAMRTVILALALSVLVSNADLGAQATPPLEPGSRIRVRAPDAGANKLVGAYLGTVADTLRVQMEELSSVRSIPFSSVVALEASRGRKSNALKGMGLGFVGGAGAGLVVGLAVDRGDDDASRLQLIGLGAGFFGACGAVVGLLTGAMITSERWEEVPLERVRASFAPQHDGRRRIGLSVAF